MTMTVPVIQTPSPKCLLRTPTTSSGCLEKVWTMWPWQHLTGQQFGILSPFSLQTSPSALTWFTPLWLVAIPPSAKLMSGLRKRNAHFSFFHSGFLSPSFLRMIWALHCKGEKKKSCCKIIKKYATRSLLGLWFSSRELQCLFILH